MEKEECIHLSFLRNKRNLIKNPLYKRKTYYECIQDFMKAVSFEINGYDNVRKFHIQTYLTQPVGYSAL